MTYREALGFLYARLPMYHRIGAAAYKADLENTVELCRVLGNPQGHFPAIHIAGTNGKGSVSHMLASILQEKGLKTGLYTSPHLKDFRERIRVDGKMIPKARVTGFLKKYRQEIERIQPSFFEMTVGMAFDHFRREKVDLAVIETGLGGRLDSTNIIRPLVSVITNISFDHMQFLGDTLEKIAAEKAGIIKPGVPVVIGESQPELLPVFLARGKECGTLPLSADTVYRVERMARQKNDPTHQTVRVLRKNHSFLRDLEVPLPGLYQLKNIATVCAVCEQLGTAGIRITKEEIRRGIEKVVLNTALAGRWQVLSRQPLTICDTGHNEAGLAFVLEQIAQTPHEKLHFVFGAVNDKEIGKILNMLPKKAVYYFCKADIPRGLDAADLSLAAKKVGLSGDAYPSVKAALKEARKRAGFNDLVFVGGSTFVVAEVV